MMELRRFVLFMLINGSPKEKFVEADRFDIDHKHGLVNFYVGPSRDGAFKLEYVIGVVEVVVEDDIEPNQ